MKKGSFAVVLSVLFSAAVAQAGTDNGLKEGGTSLSFGVPSGGNGYAAGTAGYWMLLAPNMNVGFNVGLAIDTGGNDPVWDILLAPAVRFYTATDGNVLPFFHGQANFRIFDPGSGTEDPEFGVAGGLGLEWFATKNFSIAGQVGLGIDVLRPGGADPVKIGTFTSGLTAQIYGN